MKKLQFRKKILPLILILSILFPLILIPRIDAQAATYPATTSFTYNYEGYDYQFYFSGEVDSPQDYRFDESVLNYVILKSGEGLNLAMAAGTAAKINFSDSPFLYLVYSFYHNWMVATSWFQAPWLDSSKLYGFSFEFTGIDTTYPGYGTYGPAYGWRFTGWASENVDLVLDSQGDFYGSNPIGNYTFSDDQRDFGIWSIHQHDGDDVWMPSVNSTSFDDLKAPYIIGMSLYWFYYLDGVEHEVIVEDFRDTTINFISVSTSNYKRVFPSFFNIHGISDIYIDGVLTNNKSTYDYIFVDDQNYNGRIDGMNQVYIPSLGGSNTINFGFVLPGYIYNRYSYDYNYVGWYNSLPVSGSQNLYLKTLTTSPLPDPIVLPVDDPIPVSDIPGDPIYFDPDPDPEPDPVPGIDYPAPGPVPIPVPPIPPIVSGNDDLWPDLNITFDIEDSLLDLTSNLGDFEWPQFSGLIGNFTNALIWVSTIMTTLYNGTGFSVLFDVLAVFFIAAALFGLYKWWNK